MSWRSELTRIPRLISKTFEALNATAFAVLFGVFMLQIFYRYVLNHPLSWTQEIAEILYVWIVCVGAATIVKEREHVTFSLVYVSVKPKLRRIFAIAGTGLVTLVMLITLPGNLDYILFTFRQKTPTLRLPMSVVFSAFGVFMVLIIINGVIRLYRLSRSDWEKQP
ncbi:TRAP transporter small permease [Bauldia litoralis]|uniref:TRAP transporter small permease n=1 Tax=Bauldia litoralis TaxID=665467 RepID=UPI00326680A2